MTLTILDRLARRSTITDSCWLWDGCLNSRGYGCVGIEGRSQLVHRVAFAAVNGPIADGLVIDHLCHNADPQCGGGAGCEHRRCWRPDHLDATTTRINARRSHLNGSRRTCCPQGHPYTEANTRYRGTKRSCRKCQTQVSARSAAATLAAAGGLHPPTWSTKSGYQRGCRCVDCRASNAANQRRHLERKRARLALTERQAS